MATKHSTHYYTNSIRILDAEFISNLNALIATFPYAKTYPDISTYSKTLSEQQGALDKTRSSIFILRDNIQQDIETVDNSIQNIIAQVEKLDIDNHDILQKVEMLNGQKEGANGMFEDVRELYNLNLLENWILFFSICGLGYRIIKM